MNILELFNYAVNHPGFISYEEAKDVTQYLNPPETQGLEVIYSYDKDVFSHCIRTAMLTKCFCEWLKIDESKVPGIVNAALLHDRGKTLVPISILHKASPLTKEEKMIMDRHHKDVAELVKGYATLTRYVAKYHHDKWEYINNDTQLIAVCDIFAALIEDRPYKKTLSVESALRSIKSGNNKDLNPAVVESFAKMAKNLMEEK